jgi:hypothetical protein
MERRRDRKPCPFGAEIFVPNGRGLVPFGWHNCEPGGSITGWAGWIRRSRTHLC